MCQKRWTSPVYSMLLWRSTCVYFRLTVTSITIYRDCYHCQVQYFVGCEALGWWDWSRSDGEDGAYHRAGWTSMGNLQTCTSRLWYQEARDYVCRRRWQGEPLYYISLKSLFWNEMIWWNCLKWHHVNMNIMIIAMVKQEFLLSENKYKWYYMYIQYYPARSLLFWSLLCTLCQKCNCYIILFWCFRSVLTS